MKRTGNTLKLLAGVSLLLGVLSGPAAAQDKPKEIKVGITTFLSGPAAVFGEPGKAAAEMIAADINKKGGIGGVPLALSFIDEGAGGEALVSNYRRLVQDEKVDATSPRSRRDRATSWCRWPKTSKC